MIMRQDDSGGVQFQRAAGDLPRIHRRVVDRAFAHGHLGDQTGAPVQEQYAKLLGRRMAQIGAEVIAERIPGAEQRFRFQFPTQQPGRRGMRQLQRRDPGIAQTLDGAEFGGGGGHHRPETAEPGQQFPCDRLGVPARQGEEQQHLQHLMVGQSLRTRGEQPCAHAVAMAVGADFRALIRGDAEQISTTRFRDAFPCPSGHTASCFPNRAMPGFDPTPAAPAPTDRQIAAGHDQSRVAPTLPTEGERSANEWRLVHPGRATA